MLQKEARLIGGGPDAVELHYRIGKINQDMLMDRPAAKLALRRAIDLDPAYLPGIRALVDLHRDEERWEEVLALEIQEAEHTDNRAGRADVYQHAAETALEKLEKVPEATRLYEKSLEAMADHVPSVRALADLYFAAEEWEKSERMLEVLSSRLDRQADKEELCRQLYRLAYISEKLGDDEHALKRYLASYELDSTYLPTLEGLAAALLRSERWQDAQRIYQTILVHHRDSLTDAEVVDLYFQLGDLAVRLDDVDRGRRSFDKALELDPNHPATLRAYASLSERLGEWEEAYDHRARLIDLLGDDERFEALMLQARLCRMSIADPYRAVDALTEARRILPEDPEVLRQLGALYQDTGQNARAIDALTDLSRVAETSTERRDVALELAKVHEAQDDLAHAIEALNVALDEDPQ
jgi:tetratricopeptide (TPR) repeat protein